MLQLAFVNFKPNSYIVVEGTPANDRFFIIQSGKVNSFHETQIPGIMPTVLGPGDFVGVIPCMSGHSQTESVVAMTPVVAIMVKKEQYPDLIVKNTPVAMKIVRSFTREMRILNDNLTKITLSKVIEDTPEQMFSIALYYENCGFSEIAAYGYYQYIKTCPTGSHIADATKKLSSLIKRVHPVYLEPSADLTRDYPKNSMIFSECQSGGDMFIIQEGTVKISKVVDGQEVTLALLKKGDMFGEMALLENKPRSANAIAHDACRLMVVNRENFDQMVATQPQLIARLTNMLADRLWSMYRQLANTQLFDPRSRIVDMLALQLEKQKVSVPKGQGFQTNMTPQDVVTMCGFSGHDQVEALYVLHNTQNIKMVGGKILIQDLEELLKQAAFYRKMGNKKLGESQS